MTTPKPPAATVSVHMRMPRDIYTALQAIGAVEDRSIHWLILRACRESIAAHPIKEPR